MSGGLSIESREPLRSVRVPLAWPHRNIAHHTRLLCRNENTDKLEHPKHANTHEERPGQSLNGLGNDVSQTAGIRGSPYVLLPHTPQPSRQSRKSSIFFFIEFYILFFSPCFLAFVSFSFWEIPPLFSIGWHIKSFHKAWSAASFPLFTIEPYTLLILQYLF